MSINIFNKNEVNHFGFLKSCKIHYQLPPHNLIQQTLNLGQGKLNNTGALVVNTGKFTGRSPDNRFIVNDDSIAKNIDWNKFNIPIEEKYFIRLKEELLGYLESKKDVWVRDCYACAHPRYKLTIKVANETPWSDLFVHNLFLRPEPQEVENFCADWYIIIAPGFKAIPKFHGTPNENFTIISFAHKTILIGGSAYTGEIKKAVFTVLNFLLPFQRGVLTMHCSANVGQKNETALFFGLSGTGKTTLSSDYSRKLIGDDEHGWAEDAIFNFEGGCYAKTINLDKEKEPQIFQSIRSGALVENMTFINETNEIDFNNKNITENTRVSYPLEYIRNSITPSISYSPENIFFLTCDATGVLPPISKLSIAQAMYYFISGYTSKIAGTEVGVTEPALTFSACFGAPFMPLHPSYYAEMLGEKLKTKNIQVWLVNTGWIGGPYGIGNRIVINYTRSVINAALSGELNNNNTRYQSHPVFGLMFPLSCSGIPDEILNPRNTWTDKRAYDKQTAMLAKSFINNFRKYIEYVPDEVIKASPVLIPLN